MSANSRMHLAFLWFAFAWIAANGMEKAYKRVLRMCDRARYRWQYRVGVVEVDAQVRRRGLR